MNPTYAGMLRGLVLAFVALVITFLINNAAQLVPAADVAYVPVIIMILRTIEGMIDKAKQSDPVQNDPGDPVQSTLPPAGNP